MQVLSNHYSAETAYVVDDYPYGFRLRCKIRYWLEVNGKGTRLWSQTTNPKLSGEVWNKAKASTYCTIGAMFLDEKEHVAWNGLSIYDASKAREFLNTYRVGLTESQARICEAIADAHDRRELARQDTGHF